MLVGSGFAYILPKGQSIYQIPESFVWLGLGLVILGAVLVDKARNNRRKRCGEKLSAKHATRRSRFFDRTKTLALLLAVLL